VIQHTRLFFRAALLKIRGNIVNELKHTTTATKTKVTKVRTKLKTIGTADVNTSTTVLQWCRLNDKHSILFKPRHARRFSCHFLK